jgi:hypothetical protein
MPRPNSGTAAPTKIIRGANDNGASGEACVTDAGAVLPSPMVGKASLCRGALPPELARVVRALARLMEEDEYLAVQVRPADHPGS